MLARDEKLGPIGRTVSEHSIHMYNEALQLSGESVPVSITARDYAFLLLEKYKFGKGAIHTKQKSRFLKPLQPGQHLVWEGEVVQLSKKNDKEYFAIQYWAKDQAGDTVVIHEITGIALEGFGEVKK